MRPSLTADNKGFADGRTCSLVPSTNRVLGGIEEIQHGKSGRRWWRDDPPGENTTSASSNRVTIGQLDEHFPTITLIWRLRKRITVVEVT